MSAAIIDPVVASSREGPTFRRASPRVACTRTLISTGERIIIEGSDRQERLDRVYAAHGVEDLTESYDEWASEYEGDMLSLGYMVPAVAAGLIGRFVPPGASALDAGVGTGVLGDTLEVLGYSDLVGIDLSEGMMDVARRKGAYRELRRMVLGEPLDFPDHRFDAVFSVGVFTAGHAPPDSFDELLRVVRPSGWLVFGVRDDSYTTGGFKEKQDQLVEAGGWELLRATEPFSTFPAADLPYLYRMFAYRRL